MESSRLPFPSLPALPANPCLHTHQPHRTEPPEPSSARILAWQQAAQLGWKILLPPAQDFLESNFSFTLDSSVVFLLRKSHTGIAVHHH